MNRTEKPEGAITLEILSSIRGHGEIFIKETDPAERAKLAEQVQALIKAGYAVFLMQGQDARRIKEYDAQSNEWIVVATPQEIPPETSGKIRRSYQTRLPARGSTVTGIPPMAGG